MAGISVKVLFGTRVRNLRLQRGWSQEKFAHAIGLDRSYMGGVERGERNVSLENICLIAQGLGVTPSELLDFSSSITPETDSGHGQSEV